MIKLTEAEEKFLEHASTVGGIYLLPNQIAIEYVKYCQKTGVKILGIDSFYIKGGKVQPIQDGADFEDNESQYQKAIEFIEARENTGKWFEIVPDNWKF